MSNTNQVKARSFGLTGLLVFVLAGCGVASVHPLSDPAKSKMDERLVGVWKQTVSDSENGTMMLIISKGTLDDSNKGWRDRYPAGTMQCRVSLWGRDQRLFDPAKFPIEFFPTDLGTKCYANVLERSEVDGNGKPAVAAGFRFLSYEINGDELRLIEISGDALREAIERKEIAGTVKKLETSLANTRSKIKSSSKYSISITETTENLRKFLRSGGDAKLFPRDEKRSMVFHRMK